MSYFWLVICVFSFYLIIHNFLFIGFLWIIAAVEQFFQKKKKRSSITKVSFILPVFNEENHIIEKLTNIYAGVRATDIDVDVLIGSDGCTDKTCVMVQDFIKEHGLTNWRLHQFENEGKGQTINKLVQAAQGDLIISTDADTLMEEDAINIIVEAFKGDDGLGCLSCIPTYRSKRMGIHSLYWSFEILLRSLESRLGKLIVVTGWLYAYRKKVFRDLPKTAMADDLWVPLSILLQGYRVEHRLDLKGFSEITDEATEVERRKRVMSGGVDIVQRLSGNIRKDFLLWFIVFSHKVNRWLLPLWIILFVMSSAAISFKVLYVYSFLAFLLMILLRPRRFWFLLVSIFSALFSVAKTFTGSDLSKWGHTRVK